MGDLLEIEGLEVTFSTRRGDVRALRGVDLAVAKGEILGVVGESGSGKSVTCLAAMDLLGPEARITNGSIRLAGDDLIGLPADAYRRLRGDRMSMVFQDPMTSLNPYLRSGEQIAEVLRAHRGLSRRAAARRAVEGLEACGVVDGARVARAFPHELSGGLRQRVMIASALACEPSVLFCDEPTTALDVTVQARILGLLLELRERTGCAIILVTHDFGVLAGVADRIAVVYAGRVVEVGPTSVVIGSPKHPYTRALLSSVPSLEGEIEPLVPVNGRPPDLLELPTGCAFHPRCDARIDACEKDDPDLLDIGSDVRCACPVATGAAS